MINKFRMRKLLTRALFPFFFLWCCIMPRLAYSGVPAAIPVLQAFAGAGTQVASLPSMAAANAAAGVAANDAVFAAASGLGMVDLLGAAGLVAVGASIGYIAMGGLVDGLSRIPLSSDPALQLAAPVAPSVNPAPVLSTIYQIYDANGLGGKYGSYPTQDAACAASGGTMGQYMGQAVCNYPPSACGVAVFCSPAGSFSSMPSATTSTCSSGYAVSGNFCVLSDARLAVNDGALDLSKDASGFHILPDINAVQNSKPTILPSGAVTLAGLTPAGQPAQITISPMSNGGTQIQTNLQSNQGTTSTVTSANYTLDPAGVVTSASGGTQAASLPIDPATQTSPGVNPTQGTQVNPAQNPFIFPSDYARSGEAQTAANTINPKLDKLHDDLSITTPVSDPVLPDPATMPTFGTTFDSIIGWRVPGHSSVCPKPSVDLSNILGPGHIYTLESHCTLADQYFPDIRNAAIVAWTIMALFLILRA